MQEQAVQWDPLMDGPRPSGATRLFVLYLLIVVLISLTRSIRLAAQFWRFKRSFAEADSLDEKPISLLGLLWTGDLPSILLTSNWV